MNDAFACKLYVMSANGEPLYELQPDMQEYFLQFGRMLLLKVVNKELPWAYVIYEDAKSVTKALEMGTSITIAGVELDIKPWQPTDDRAAAEAQEIRQIQQAFKVTAQSKTVDIIDVNVPTHVAPDHPIKFSLRIKNKHTQPRVFKGVRQVNFWKESEIKDNLPRKGSKSSQVSIGAQKTHDIEVIVCTEDREVESLRAKSVWKDHELDLSDRRTVPYDPEEMTRKPHVEAIPAYDIPPEIVEGLDSGSLAPINPWNSRDNWRTALHDLLFIEEVEQRKQIRRYDLFDVALQSVKSFQRGSTTVTDTSGHLIRIPVPCLSECRPIIHEGDRVFVWSPRQIDVEWEGVVHYAEPSSIICLFNSEFYASGKLHDGKSFFNVRFGFNRLHMRCMHRALDKIPAELVWPSESIQQACLTQPERSQFKKNDISLHDKRIGDSSEQHDAVVQALNRHVAQLKPAMLLTGPSASGKTLVLTEIIKQLIHHVPSSKILICTSRSTSADQFALRLSTYDELSSNSGSLVGGARPVSKKGVQTGPKMIRLISSNHRVKDMVPADLLPYTFFNDDAGHFDVPPMDKLKQLRVVVTTCLASCSLASSGIQQGFFTHIIIDEAGQMCEPEVFVPLSLAAHDKTVVILAGDSKSGVPRLQCGSIVQSELNSSILDRLSQLPLYQDSKKLFSSPLTKNFRSHPLLLQFLSKRFYGDTIQTRADTTKTERLSNWTKLKKKLPVLFAGVNGEDMRESDSPCFFNPVEAAKVGKLVADLRQDPNLQLDPSECAVVTFFSQQVNKIKQVLKHHNCSDIFVGTPEQLVGKEFNAVFVSTSRSSRRWLEKHDKVLQSDLLNEKVLNSIASISSGLFVVIGDPYVLQSLDHWSDLIAFCSNHGCYSGPTLSATYMADREKQDAKLHIVEYAPIPLIAAKLLPTPITDSGSLDVDTMAPGANHDEPTFGDDMHRIMSNLSDGDSLSEAPLQQQLPTALSSRRKAPNVQRQSPLSVYSEYLRLQQLQQQMAPANPAWIPIYHWRNTFELILLPDGAQPPPFNIADKRSVLEIQVCKFNSIASAQKNGETIFLQLSPAKPDEHAVVFYQPSAATMMIRVPTNEFDVEKISIVENQSYVVVGIPRQQQASKGWQPVPIRPAADPEVRMM